MIFQFSHNKGLCVCGYCQSKLEGRHEVGRTRTEASLKVEMNDVYLTTVLGNTENQEMPKRLQKDNTE